MGSHTEHTEGNEHRSFLAAIAFGLIPIVGFAVLVVAIFGTAIQITLRSDNIAGDKIADVVVGCLFGVAVFMLTFPYIVIKKWLWPLPLAIAFVIAATLMFWHEAVWTIRTAAPRTLTVNRIKMARLALEEYAKDVGRLPTKQQGFDALLRDPGEKNWKGPYLENADLVDSWGTRLQFRIVGKQVEVFSAGRDGVHGTDDDLVFRDGWIGRENSSRPGER